MNHGKHWNGASAASSNARRSSALRIPSNAWVKSRPPAQERALSGRFTFITATPLHASLRAGITDGLRRGPARRRRDHCTVHQSRRDSYRREVALGAVAFSALLAVLAWAATGNDNFAVIGVLLAAGAASVAIALTAPLYSRSPSWQAPAAAGTGHAVSRDGADPANVLSLRPLGSQPT